MELRFIQIIKLVEKGSKNTFFLKTGIKMEGILE